MIAFIGWGLIVVAVALGVWNIFIKREEFVRATFPCALLALGGLVFMAASRSMS